MDLTRLLELLKLKPEALLCVLMGTGILVFMPESALIKLGLLAFVSTFRGWIGGIFLLSMALLLGNGLSAAVRQVGIYISGIKDSRKKRDSFQHLSPPEKALLAKYYINKTSTQYFQISDGVANGLEVKGFIYRASTVAVHHMSFAFNLQPWAWKCLQDNPGLVINEAMATDA
jgi:hypothetical protein